MLFLPFAQATHLPVDIIKGHLPKEVPHAGHINDSSPLPSSQDLIHQQIGKQKVTNMVGAELQLNPFGCCLVGCITHDAGIVDQDVNLIDTGIDLLCCLTDGDLRGEIERDELGFDFGVELVDFFDHGCGLGFSATSEDDQLGVSIGQRNGCVGSDTAGTGTGDEDWVMLVSGCHETCGWMDVVAEDSPVLPSTLWGNVSTTSWPVVLMWNCGILSFRLISFGGLSACRVEEMRRVGDGEVI